MKWIEVIKNRIRHFQSIYHAHEAGRLTLALKAIEELIPPSDFDESTPPEGKGFSEAQMVDCFISGNNLPAAENESEQRIWAHNFINTLPSPPVKDDWVSVNTPPNVGGEYNVVWDLEDDGEPVTSTMEYDAINKIWVDTRGANTECKTVLLYQPLPHPPKDKTPQSKTK